LAVETGSQPRDLGDLHRYPTHERGIYLAPLGTEIAVFYPDMLLLSENSREKVTFLASTTRTKVTFDPENGDLPGANSREKVTMHPEKGDFCSPHFTIRNYPGKGDLLFPVFRGSPMGNCNFYRSNNLPGER
jgi:hypothetical protein